MTIQLRNVLGTNHHKCHKIEGIGHAYIHQGEVFSIVAHIKWKFIGRVHMCHLNWTTLRNFTTLTFNLAFLGNQGRQPFKMLVVLLKLHVHTRISMIGGMLSKTITQAPRTTSLSFIQPCPSPLIISLPSNSNPIPPPKQMEIKKILLKPLTNFQWQHHHKSNHCLFCGVPSRTIHSCQVK